MKKTVAILFGGISSEHEVSCMSAAGIIKNIDYTKYNVIPIGITKEGNWLKTCVSAEKIENGAWINSEENRSVTLSINSNYKGMIDIDACKALDEDIDIIFPILHGKYGEDGNIQGILECSGIPYIGCNTLSSAVCFDKVFTKELIAYTEVPQADYMVLKKDFPSDSYNETCVRIDKYFHNNYPLFVKPAREGSSVGISKVDCFEQIEKALKKGLACDSKVLIEEGVIGREIEVAVLGTDEPKVSVIGEIFAADTFYTYDAKYKNKESRTSIVDDISQETMELIKEYAIRVYKKLECKDLARVDFFLKENGTPIFNEINTLPGFTPISMYPKLWEYSGLSYTDLITGLIEEVCNC